MKLLYLANQRLPTEKAYGLQIAKMCEAFVVSGLDVELLVPTRRNSIKKDPFLYYGIRRNFKFGKIWAPDFYLPGKLDFIAFWIKNLISAQILCCHALWRKADFVFSRDELPLYFLSFFRKNLVYEAHKFPRPRIFMFRRFKKCGIKIVAISRGLAGEFLKLGFNSADVLVASDGVDLEFFDIRGTKQEARSKLNLPVDKKLVIYTGQLFDWKGADVLAQSAARLPAICFIFVGGTQEDLTRFSERFSGAENIKILGPRSHAEIPYFLKAADILVLPNIRDGGISEFYTSPLKLFEYLAAGRPIIASDLPSIKEILNDQVAVFFEPGNDTALAEAINRILADKDLSEKISKNTRSLAAQYSWRHRAMKIYEKFFI